jgi:hypothetical protein
LIKGRRKSQGRRVSVQEVRGEKRKDIGESVE